MPAIKASKKAYTILAAKNKLLFPLTFEIFLLECNLYIYYIFCFKKNQVKIQALLDFGSEINAMAPTYAASLDLNLGQ